MRCFNAFILILIAFILLHLFSPRRGIIIDDDDDEQTSPSFEAFYRVGEERSCFGKDRL